ncbi:MAG: 2-oxoacid:acceptor oxidoreductase family protein [Armatimonadota bacterium]|nr:2-oxoacid:acceptor oxidoreductase family protein [Armatimonadota bacterium]MCX7776970.1 2-oxoacid:acceptor oxidoreductase family protein [Armatimonadota bacterium]MDW8024804.1 2-oxoacid:acceptor oxidoreductase family protein [Armatimonadota bacterium]
MKDPGIFAEFGDDGVVYSSRKTIIDVKPIEVRWHGRAGQGIRTVALLLGHVALAEGKWTQAFPQFGPERRGAAVEGFTRIADVPLTIHGGIVSPDVVVVIDDSLLTSASVLNGLRQDTTLIANVPYSAKELRNVHPVFGALNRVAAVDATAISLDTIKRNMPNTPMLGAVARVTGTAKLETLKSVLTEHLPERVRRRAELLEANLNAVERGYNEVQVDEEPTSPPEVIGEYIKGATLPSWEELSLGGIIPQPATSLSYKTGSWRSELRPVWDAEKCTNCYMCFIHCPDNAILIKDGKVIGIDYEYCKGCGICAAVCPPKVKAITMHPEREAAPAKQ